jgi:hypothetical protein
MEFNRLVEDILKENNNKEVFVIIYKENVIKEGDEIPIESLLNKNMGGPLKLGGEPITWILARVHLAQTHPKILTFNGGRKEVAVPDAFNEGTYFSIVRDNKKIDVDKMNKVTTFNVELEPQTGLSHGSLTSKWNVFQSDNKDGTHTAWYNPMHGAGPSVVLDFEIASKAEHERKTVIASHKEHNPFIDLLEL